MDIYTTVTQRIIDQLKQGTIPWRKPWSSPCGACSHVTGKPYSLLNQALLDGHSGEYLTFQQARKEGGHVRKGEKSSLIVFFKFIDTTDDDTGESKTVPFLRYIPVFHIDQCEGIRPRFTSEQNEWKPAIPADAAAEQIISSYIARSGVKLTQCLSSEAFYRPSTDEVVLPLKSQFSEASAYYSTAFHELTHSTGHASRLNRLADKSRFGTSSYSREEFCAELGASYLLNRIGLETPDSFRSNAAYIAQWLSVLKSDKHCLISAAGKADKAVRLILGEEASNHEP